MKTPVIYNTYYTVYFENYRGATFVHCDCAKWTKEIKKQLRQDFNKLLSIHRNDVYALHELNDAKHEKFLKVFGFSFLSEFIGVDGLARHIYVRRT
jgi:hypothetical protein